MALLRNRNFRLWFLAAGSSTIGDWAGLFALQILVARLQEPGSRLALFSLGAIMMARLLPSLFFGPVAGVLADRYDRKRLMVSVDVLRGALFLLIALSSDLVALFALTFFVECLALLYISSKDAVLPSLVERRHLKQANQLNLLVTYGTLPLGGLLGTALAGMATLLRDLGAISVDPIVATLLFDSATFAVAALLVSRMRMPSRARRAEEDEEGRGALEELREGIRFIRDLPLIRALILGVVGVFFGAGIVVTIGPEFVRSTLGRPATDWQLLITAVGLGLAAGIAGVALLPERVPKERAFPIGIIATGVVAVVLALLDNFWVALGLGFLLGAVGGVSFVLGYTLLHEHTRDENRGKTFAAFYTGTRVALFASLGLAPFLAGAIGVFSVEAAGAQIRMSGVRVTILLGGLIGLFSALSAGRAMWRAHTEGDGPRMSLPGTPGENETDGLFIAFEGVEGSGKSTQVQALARTLREEGHDVVVTREPGGPPVAERIRDLLLDPDGSGMDVRTEVLLYAAARAEHVAHVIRPALDAGKVVVCDRFIDSSIAYQGHAREQDSGDIAEISHWAAVGVRPDVTILLHLDPEEGLQRVTERARRGGDDGAPTTDRMEAEDLDFHRRVASGYLTLARRNRDRYVIIDATGDAGTIARQVRSALDAWVPLPVGAP